MATRKTKKVEFPPERCGACTFCCSLGKDSYECLVNPPSIIGYDSNDDPLFGRSLPCNPNAPICFYFKPRMTA